jgi:hypothetical protein
MLCDYYEDPMRTAAVTVIVRNRMRQFCGLSCAGNYLEDMCGRYPNSPGLVGSN